VLELIEKKAEGQEIVAPAEPKATTPVVDLMAALEASLAAAKGDSKAPPAKKGKDDEAEGGKAGRKAS
jgi:non-homologous end joining protein Ku